MRKLHVDIKDYFKQAKDLDHVIAEVTNLKEDFNSMMKQYNNFKDNFKQTKDLDQMFAEITHLKEFNTMDGLKDDIKGNLKLAKDLDHMSAEITHLKDKEGIGEEQFRTILGEYMTKIRNLYDQPMETMWSTLKDLTE